MPLMISDAELSDIGLTAEEARLELACRMFASQRLTLGQAARWASLSRLDFEDALIVRRIPVYRMTAESWDQEVTSCPTSTPAS